MRDDRERLEDILGAIQDIERYAARGREAFEIDDLIQSWMVHHLMILGEAANGVGGPVRDASPRISWSLIVAMRNILVHEYFGVDLAEVWRTVEHDLPPLKNNIQALLDNLRQDSES